MVAGDTRDKPLEEVIPWELVGDLSIEDGMERGIYDKYKGELFAVLVSRDLKHRLFLIKTSYTFIGIGPIWDNVGSKRRSFIDFNQQCACPRMH